MTPDQLRALAARLRDHAAMHESVIPHDDEQRQWRDDMLDAAKYLIRCAKDDPAAVSVVRLAEKLSDALSSVEFYHRRFRALEQWQSRMRDPERTIVCDILANGATLEPAGDRYSVKDDHPQPPSAQSDASDKEIDK